MDALLELNKTCSIVSDIILCLFYKFCVIYCWFWKVGSVL